MLTAVIKILIAAPPAGRYRSDSVPWHRWSINEKKPVGRKSLPWLLLRLPQVPDIVDQRPKGMIKSVLSF